MANQFIAVSFKTGRIGTALFDVIPTDRIRYGIVQEMLTFRLCGRKVCFAAAKFRYSDAKFSMLLYEQNSLIDMQL